MTKLCTGGELCNQVNKKLQGPEGYSEEEDAEVLVSDILDASCFFFQVLIILWLQKS